MNGMKMNRVFATVAAVMGSLTALSVSHADIIYDVDFSTLTEAPADWTPLSPSTNLAGWELSSGGYGYVRDNSGQPNGGLNSYTGLVDGGGSASSLTDYMVDSSFWKSSAGASNFTGVAARIQDADNYYTAFLNAANQLFIRKVTGGTNADLKVVNFDGTYSADEKWRITFSVVGNQLEANVYDSAGDLAASAAVTDDTFSSGTFGLRVQTSVGHGLFESLTASTTEAPEPLLVTDPESGHIFDLGVIQIGEDVNLASAISFTNDGTGIISRTGVDFVGSGLFDIAGFIREGDTIAEGQTHNYDVVFFGSEVVGLHEAVATIHTTAGDVTYTLRATVVPEPASLALLGIGVAMIAGRSRRRQTH